MPIGAMMSGVGLTVFKKLDYKVYPLVGCALTAVSSGLYTLMTPSSPQYVTVGNLILGGLAGGLSIMVPLLVAQAAVPAADVSVATSTMQFFQSIAGLLAIAVMQSYFNQQTDALLPAVKAEYAAAMAAGTPAALAQAAANAAAATSKAVTGTFYISIAGALAGVVATCFLRWVPLGGEQEAANAKAAGHAGDTAAAGAPEVAGAGVTLRVEGAAAV